MTAPRRYAPRSGQQWADALGNLKRTGRLTWAGPCPLCGGTDRLHVTDRESGALVGCRGCIDSEPDALRRRRFGELTRATFGDASRADPPATPPKSVDRGNRKSSGRSLPRGRPIPAAADHPIRRWLDNRNLWRPGYPLPSGMGTMQPDSRYPPTCAARMVASLAPFGAWADAWPYPPRPTAIQIIAIGADGAPAIDRPVNIGGVGKRTIGKAAAGVFAIGDPAAGEIRLCEGIADCLAIAARFDCLAIAAVSAGQLPQPAPDLLDRLASAARVIIHADADTSVAGQGAAIRLASAINREGGNARAVAPAGGYGDPADWAAAHPFPPVDTQAAREYADTLAAMYPHLPTWERYRVASIAATHDR